MLPRLFSLLLLLLTRDGLLHRFDGAKDSTSPAPHASAVAVVAGKLALLAGKKLTIDGKAVPGDFSDVRALAGGPHQLWAINRAGVVRIDPRRGQPTVELVDPHVHRLAVDGDEAFAEIDGVIVQVGTPRRWKVPGRPIALAAGNGRLWAATKEGPLFQVDRQSGEVKKLEGIGDWWTTLALACSEGQLYAVTLSGKVWRIDPGSGASRPEKTIVAMDGWQGTIDLAVLR
jgi:hypothetical protein